MNTNRRILIIDDNRAIHEDFRKILMPANTQNAELSALEAELLGSTAPATPQRESFQITSAFQGREGLEAVQKAEINGMPFALVFLDVRMPPGWDGVETAGRIWQVATNLQIVICTAYSDYSWDQIVEKLGNNDLLSILHKPFDPIEVLQIANSLTEKWTKLNGV